MNKEVYALIADIGATHSRIALVGHTHLYHTVSIYKSADYTAPDAIINSYCTEHRIELPAIIVLAIAAPTEIDEIKFVNNHWHFRLSEVRTRLSPSKVYFYNDVEMLGLSLPFLPTSSLVQVGSGKLNDYAPKLALSLGSGIGTSLAIFNHDWLVIPSEGGQSDMMINDELTLKFLQSLKKLNQDKIVIEDFIAGKKGIPQLIQFMAEYFGISEQKYSPTELVDQLVNEKSEFAKAVFDQYCVMIGTVAKNYTLITGAKSVYIAGGIIPRFLDFFMKSNFRLSFEDSLSMQQILKNTPTFVIVDPYPALIGLTQKIIELKEQE